MIENMKEYLFLLLVELREEAEKLRLTTEKTQGGERPMAGYFSVAKQHSLKYLAQQFHSFHFLEVSSKVFRCSKRLFSLFHRHNHYQLFPFWWTCIPSKIRFTIKQ
jgi:hypothetical protein